MNTTGLLFLAVYMLLFFATLIAVMWWDRRRRRTRKPFPEDLKLLRMPGEFLWRRVVKNDEDDMQWWLGIMVVPILAGAGVLYVVAQYFRSYPSVGLVATLMVFTFCMLLSVRWCLVRLQRRSDDYLGCFGERYVAEWLEPLKAERWFIFHDIPCEGATGRFNLDHVAVGPGGIWVVETKTRRKGRARAGFKEHEVFFDGNQIIWPWGEDKSALKQAFENARWLREWLGKMTGKTFEVSAVLTFPGYCVVERKLGAVRVANPKVLPAVLNSRGKNLLANEEIDLVRRQLEEKCRDVVY